MTHLFDQMPGHSKVWVYQADRPLTLQDIEHINGKLTTFTGNWQAHSQSVKGGHAILHNRFVILAADEQAQAVTGCSIDSSVKVIRELEDELKLSLTNRTLVAYLDKQEQIKTLPLADMKHAAATGQITPNSLIFNNGIVTLAQLSTDWQIPASKSWAKRYFKMASASN